MKSEDITGGLDLLGDWLDAKGYTEEAGLCTRAMDEINRLYDWKDKAGDMDRVKTVELVDLRAEIKENIAFIRKQADEIARLREALKNARSDALKEGAEIAFAYNGMPRSEIAQAFARAARGESDE